MAMDLRRLLSGHTGQAVGGRAHSAPPYFRTKKLAILGCTSNVVFAPWRDPSWTLASHCSARQACQREPDWYFDMHRPACFEQLKNWNTGYQRWLQQLQSPIFMQEDADSAPHSPWAQIPAAVRYPIERITAEFASSATGQLYATNHAAYMIALAMTEGVTHIGLYGCQYASNSEYGVQRDSLSYWMGRFEQYGGKLVVPPKWNTLLSQPKGLYGYASHDEHGKLVDEYKLRSTPPAKPGAIAVPVDPQTGACEVPLMASPTGEPPNLERAQELFGGEVLHDMATATAAVV